MSPGEMSERFVEHKEVYFKGNGRNEEKDHLHTTKS